MERNRTARIAGVALVGWLVAAAPALALSDEEAVGFERTPPRLSLVDGEVSFFRAGADDWTPASVNTPLAAGDELYASEGANLELQIGPRAYLRAGEETRVALTGLEPDFLQLRLTEGFLSVDLRTLKASQTIEVDTPNAAFTIESSGYYRIEVREDTSTLVTRRGGAASFATAQGLPFTVAASEQVVITGTENPQVETYVAPDLDAWDRWNYVRTDTQLESVSARYVPPGVYGVADLDNHGTWRVVPTYGAIWVPSGVAVGWAPYSTGRWIYDPYYSWTWVDAAPWGWAPYHYGRWVHVSGYWGWAPGPIVARPYYAPALVSFSAAGSGGGFSFGFSVGGPIGWFALGWGEPISPWWGPASFRAAARWGGWGGPRVVNNVVIKNKTVVQVKNVHRYRNEHVRNAFVAVDRKHFGRGPVREARIASPDVAKFRSVRGELKVRPSRASLSPSNEKGRRPPRERPGLAVVATRAPRAAPVLDVEAPRGEASPAAGRGRKRGGPAAVAEPAVRVVESPKSPGRRSTRERPPFATRGEERRSTRQRPPRYEKGSARKQASQTPSPERAAKSPKAKKAHAGTPRPPATARATAPRDRQAKGAARRAAPRKREAPAGAKSAPTREAGAAEARDLPGVPANRVYRSRGKRARAQQPAAPARDPGGGRSSAATRGDGSSRGNGFASGGRSSRGADGRNFNRGKRR